MRKVLFLIGMVLAAPILPLACSDGGTQTSTSSGSSSGMGDGTCVDDNDCKVGFNNICLPTDDGMCGPQTKKCVEFPPSCGEGTFTTVCGCDGKSHAKGPCPGELTYQIDTRPDSCKPAAGTFFCGDGACTIGAQYCVEGDTSVDCLDLPANCMGAQATCACLGALGMMGCGCEELAGGGIVINGCGI
jgi:hypothetical protein